MDGASVLSRGSIFAAVRAAVVASSNGKLIMIVYGSLEQKAGRTAKRRLQILVDLPILLPHGLSAMTALTPPAAFSSDREPTGLPNPQGRKEE
jgi:hypothetical protein